MVLYIENKLSSYNTCT